MTAVSAVKIDCRESGFVTKPIPWSPEMPRRKISAADRISSLPDGVLCHILSFLPTKRAVATSVLSKRWTHLWRSVPALHFDYYDTIGKDGQAYFRFNEFVHSVLLSRDAAHSIKSFRLDHIGNFYNKLPNVNKWVNFVIHRRVEYLHLHANSPVNSKLPVSILSCTTLVVLKFYGFPVEGFSSVGLPSLKILHLEYIRFPKVRDFALLLAGCPILEDLQASYIEFDFDSEDSLTDQEFKSLSKLSRADITGCYCHSLLKALYNVESLRIEIDKIYRHDDDIPTFHNLTRLELFSLNFDWHLLVEVLKHCPKLQHLDLYQYEAGDTLWSDEDIQENWVHPEFVPQCLSLHLRTCNLWDLLGLQGELMLGRYILKNARVLQTMTIRCGEPHEIKRKLSSCPRASTTCQLSVEQ